MPRKARAHSSTGIYHITLRGINRRFLFNDEKDFAYFTGALRRLKTKTGATFYACCLMDNHVHLLMKEGHGGICKDMNHLCSSYAAYYSKKYETYGYVFQDRFHSTPVEDDDYFYTCLEYIYENPVEAGIVEKPEDYRWLWVNSKLREETQQTGKRLVQGGSSDAL